MKLAKKVPPCPFILFPLSSYFHLPKTFSSHIWEDRELFCALISQPKYIKWKKERSMSKRSPLLHLIYPSPVRPSATQWQKKWRREPILHCPESWQEGKNMLQLQKYNSKGHDVFYMSQNCMALRMNTHIPIEQTLALGLARLVWAQPG